MNVREFIDWSKEVHAEREWGYMDYMHVAENSDLESALPAMPFRQLLGPECADVQPTLWIGTTGAHTAMHYDAVGWGVHVQAIGTKLWIFVPPIGTEADRAAARGADGLRQRLELMQAARTPYEKDIVLSEVDVFGNAEFLQGIAGLRVFLAHAGDVVFVPPLWWHAVCCVSEKRMLAELSFSCSARLLEHNDVFNTICERVTKQRMYDPTGALHYFLHFENPDDPFLLEVMRLRERGRRRYDLFLETFGGNVKPLEDEYAKIDRTKMGLTFIEPEEERVELNWIMRPQTIMEEVRAAFASDGPSHTT